ncbi:MAG TPA: hypothetical protein VKQ52_10775 [Puia sp.]|nr:hypothetical protein [Puia sp.]
MDPDHSTPDDLKASILSDIQAFLISLEAGASNEQLDASLTRIREREILLLKEKGLMLSPVLWKIMHSRFANKKDKDIIDTTGYGQ